jgi:EAL domain-containing protein (putative c-di-GMP-specific phosphodiesterase class I)
VTGLSDRRRLHDLVEAIQRTSPPATGRWWPSSTSDCSATSTTSAPTPATCCAPGRPAARQHRLPHTHALRYEGAEFVVVFEQIENAEDGRGGGPLPGGLLTPEFDLGVESITINPGGRPSAPTTTTRRRLHPMPTGRCCRPATTDRAGTVHDESKRGRYETRIDEDRLRSAITNNEFVLAYQPIVRLDNGQIIGFEGLLRWLSPSATRTGVLYPRDFMPLLEKSGLSVRVGAWVVHEACRQAAAWNRRFPGRPALFVTANVGARQMAATTFKDQVTDAITTSGIQPWQLCLDITEEALRFNRSTAWTALRELKDLGVKLGLDDFGTGVSSFAYLREFTLDLLRVDRSFVEDVTISEEDQAIIRHITGLAHDLGLVAVAEGVETDEQVAALRELGVDLGQGFFLGRPMTPDEVNDLLDPITADEAGSHWKAEDVLDYEV